MRFRKKPLVIEAVQFHYRLQANGIFAAAREVEGVRGAKTWWEKLRDWVKGFPHYYVDTLEGSLSVSNGDWIIKGINGEFYPCKPDIFRKTYELADPQPEWKPL